MEPNADLDVEEEYAFGRESVLAAIEAVREGKCVVVTDDEGRENEGDLVFAAEKVSGRHQHSGSLEFAFVALKVHGRVALTFGDRCLAVSSRTSRGWTVDSWAAALFVRRCPRIMSTNHKSGV